MKKLFVFILVLAAIVSAQTQNNQKWATNNAIDTWTVKQAGNTAATWDSITTAAVWSEPFLTYDYMSVKLSMLLDSVRVKAEYWSGLDTARATMTFGRALEWDKAANLDSTYISSTGYWNSNITQSAIPNHQYGRIKITPGLSGSRKIKAAGLFTIQATGRK